MEKSSTPACLGFCGRAKLLRPAGVDVVLASGEVQFRAAASLEPLFERLEGRGKCKSRHAAKGSGEAGGSNYGQGVEDWEANFNDQGREEAERREAKCGRVFVEGREDTKCIGDCGGNAQEEGNVDEEGSAEEGGGVEEEGFGDQQPNTYEAERNKRVANVQERLQLILSAKCSIFSAPEKSKSHKAKPLSTSLQELPRRRSLRLAQLTPTTMVEETNPLAHATLSNARTSSQERGVDPHFPAGVGSSATKPTGATTDTRKRQSATPPSQPPLEKHQRVETSQPQHIEATACEQPTYRNHPRSEMLSQQRETREEGIETWAADPHLSQGPPQRRGWQSSGQIAYRESISDATIADPTYAHIGDQTYIPNIHQQSRGVPYQRSQQRAAWSQDGSQEYDEDGYILGARTQNWQERAWDSAHWGRNGPGFPSQPGGGWRGRPSSARIPPGSYPSHPSRPPIARPIQQRRGHHLDFESIREPVYLDRGGFEEQPLHRMAFYDEGDRSGYDRPVIGYNNTDSLGLSNPSLQGLRPYMGPPYPMAAPPQMELPGSDRRAECVVDMPSGLHIPSNESLNPDNSTTRECGRAEDSVHTSQTQKNLLSGRKERRKAQHVYEAEEADRKDRGLKPHAIVCDTMGVPDDTGRPGSRFMEVLKALCTIFLDLSIVKVGMQDPDDYASLRDEVESEFEWVGHKISDVGFKKAVSKCMKAERQRLHKLYLTKPDRDCPPREEPYVWGNLKAYWKSPDFEKVSKRKSLGRDPTLAEASTQKSEDRSGSRPPDFSTQILNVSANMVARLETLESKIPDCESFRVDVGALVSELAVLNSNVKALTEALVSNLKQTQDNTQYQSKAVGQKTLASSTPNAKACMTSPSGSPSPSTKHNGSHKGNESLASGAQVAERSRSNTREHSRTQSGGLLPEQSPTRLDMNVHAPPPIATRLSSADEDATTVDEMGGRSISPSSDCAFAPPPMEAITFAPKSKKRTPCNARRKNIANDTLLDVHNDFSEEPEMTFPIATTQKDGGRGRGKGNTRLSTRQCKPTQKVASNRANLPPKKFSPGAWSKGDLVDLYHPDEPGKKVAECCNILGCAGEPFHGMTIATGMFKVNVGRVFDEDCPLFVTVEDDMPPQLKLRDVKRGMTVWPGSYLRPYDRNPQ